MRVLALGDAAPLGRGHRFGARARVGGAARARSCRRASCPKSDEAQFEVSVRAPEGTSLDGHRAHRRAHRPRDPRACPASSSTLVTIGDTEQQTPNFAQHLREADRPRRAQASAKTSMMDRVRREIVAKQPQDLRVTVSRGRRFLRAVGAHASIMYVHQRPRSRRSSQGYAEKRRQEQLQEGARRGRRRHHARLGKPEVTRSHRPREGRRPGRPGGRRRGRPCASWSAA